VHGVGMAVLLVLPLNDVFVSPSDANRECFAGEAEVG
jgi:hypothetical protein